jgi:hypothetical protein
MQKTIERRKAISARTPRILQNIMLTHVVLLAQLSRQGGRHDGAARRGVGREVSLAVLPARAGDGCVHTEND